MKVRTLTTFFNRLNEFLLPINLLTPTSFQHQCENSDGELKKMKFDSFFFSVSLFCKWIVFHVFIKRMGVKASYLTLLLDV